MEDSEEIEVLNINFTYPMEAKNFVSLYSKVMLEEEIEELSDEKVKTVYFGGQISSRQADDLEILKTVN